MSDRPPAVAGHRWRIHDLRKRESCDGVSATSNFGDRLTGMSETQHYKFRQVFHVVRRFTDSDRTPFVKVTSEERDLVLEATNSYELIRVRLVKVLDAAREEELELYFPPIQLPVLDDRVGFAEDGMALMTEGSLVKVSSVKTEGYPSGGVQKLMDEAREAGVPEELILDAGRLLRVCTALDDLGVVRTNVVQLSTHKPVLLTSGDADSIEVTVMVMPMVRR